MKHVFKTIGRPRSSYTLEAEKQFELTINSTPNQRMTSGYYKLTNTIYIYIYILSLFVKTFFTNQFLISIFYLVLLWIHSKFSNLIRPRNRYSSYSATAWVRRPFLWSKAYKELPERRVLKLSGVFLSFFLFFFFLIVLIN